MLLLEFVQEDVIKDDQKLALLMARLQGSYGCQEEVRCGGFIS